MITRFVDCDMFMRYHWGLGVGHVYTHNQSDKGRIPRVQDIERDEQENNQDEDDHHSLSDSSEIRAMSEAEEVRGLGHFDEQSESDSESTESTDNDADDDILNYEN